MYFRVRKIGDKDLIVSLSRVSSILHLKKIVTEKLAIEPENQTLLYRGKELSDEYRIVDYGIQLNDVVQLIDRKTFRNDLSDSKSTKSDEVVATNLSDSSGVNPNNNEFRITNEAEDEIEVPCKSKYYKKGDYIEFMDNEYGSWLEGIVVDIIKKTKGKESTEYESQDEDILFKVKMDISGYPHEPFCLKFNEIRPRARRLLSKKELNVGDIVLVNYNDEEPKTRGLWYDFIIENLNGGVSGTVMAGNTVFENCTVRFTNEIMQIEKPDLIENRKNDKYKIAKRKTVYRCNSCKGIPSKKCNECGCKVCLSKENINSIILCDDCDSGYHISCLNPPLSCIPLDSNWYCPECKTDTEEIVKPGDKLKISNKRAKKPSNKQDAAGKEWGRGMACIGRTKECTIVPIHHFGPIPGVEVGTCWKFRVQVSEAGVHRQSVAGIHGREVDGAYSIVLSGGYEDDVDNGDEFYYTGCGGRDLSGNKRISVQSFDQSLTSMNKALALNCNTKFNDKSGGEAVDWKAGKPVRVVRNYKLAKHSKYAPKEGNRYDGIYKVVKYFPEKGISGFLVWRFLLRRDDPAPPPWDKDGQQLPMLYPEGYFEALLEKNKQDSSRNGRKRKIPLPNYSTLEMVNKKAKVIPYELDDETKEIIDTDKTNKNVWAQCKSALKDGKQKFLQTVERAFSCICCFEVVYLPVITPCKHIVCKSCLQRSLSAEIYTCPYCRYELGMKFKLVVAQNLSKALLQLFPGYENER